MRPILAALLSATGAFAANTLIVADEFPAMEGLAKHLSGPTRVIAQDAMPKDLASFSCVVVYIHQSITPEAEHAFIRYTDAGGRLVLLHHSISSGKRKNQDWLPWLGIELPDKPYEQGGYKWIEGTDFEFFNKRGETIEFRDSEVYLNHVFKTPRTLIWSLRYKGMEQPTGAWYKKSGKGEVFYFMAGHNASDFDIPRFQKDVVAAIEGTLNIKESK